MYAVVFICSLNFYVTDSIYRAILGKDSGPSEYLYVVRLVLNGGKTNTTINLNKNIYVCTASVLTNKWSLTAAHCIEVLNSVQSYEFLQDPKVLIRYGSESGIPSEECSLSEIVSWIEHPAYLKINEGHNVMVKNDIGLLKSLPIQIEQFAKLSAVDYKSMPGHAANAMGYGLINDSNKVDDTLKLGKGLQVLNVLIKRCPRESKDTQILYPALCLSRRCGSPSTMCPGDSGGPIIHTSGIVAIISSGISQDCSMNSIKKGRSSNIVAYATPLSPYIAWISDYISRDKG